MYDPCSPCSQGVPAVPDDAEPVDVLPGGPRTLHEPHELLDDRMRLEPTGMQFEVIERL